MGLSQSLFTGVTGLRGHQTRLDVIGNNLANVNTVGFRRSTVEFGDLISHTISDGQAPQGTSGGTDPMQIGLGSLVEAVHRDLTTAGFEATGNTQDLAIEGNGFFVVRNGTEQMYTLDGTFRLDANGDLVTAAGNHVQGTLTDPVTGLPPTPTQGGLHDLHIQVGQTDAVASTSQMGFIGNLSGSGLTAGSGSRLESAQLFTRLFDGTSAAAGAAVVADNVISFVPSVSLPGFTTADNLAKVSIGDQVFLSGAGVNQGLYTVTAKDMLAGTVTVTGSSTVSTLSGPLTVNVPATRLTNLRTAAHVEDSTALMGGVFDESGNLLMQNQVTDAFPTVDVIAQKGSQSIKRTFQYGDPSTAAPGIAEFDGTTLGDFASFLQDVLGLSTASATAGEAPGVPNIIPVGSGSDDGVADGDNFNEARVSFGRASDLGGAGGIGAAVARTGTGSLASGTGGGTVLVDSSATNPFAGLVAGDEIRLSGTGVTEGYYRVSDASVIGDSVTLVGLGPVAQDSAGRTGVTGVKWELAPNRLYVNGNLGTANGITQLQFRSGTTNADIFSNGVIEQATGESAFTTARFFDSAGGEHELDLTLVQVGRTSGSSTWRWYAEAPDDSTRVVTPGTPPAASGRNTHRSVGWGDIVFDANGTFVRAEPDALGHSRQVTVDLASSGVLTPQNINIDFSKLTQFASSESVINMSTQNGNAAGVLQNYSVSRSGDVTGQFSNGVSKVLGKVAMANFQNAEGLLAVGSNNFREDTSSGPPLVGSAGTLGLGSIVAGSLNLSNVDIAQEFTDMIVTQRAFQANARTITVSDQLLVELVNLIH
jgi:flagellar hook protein FlgE